MHKNKRARKQKGREARNQDDRVCWHRLSGIDLHTPVRYIEAHFLVIVVRDGIGAALVDLYILVRCIDAH